MHCLIAIAKVATNCNLCSMLCTVVLLKFCIIHNDCSLYSNFVITMARIHNEQIRIRKVYSYSYQQHSRFLLSLCAEAKEEGHQLKHLEAFSNSHIHFQGHQLKHLEVSSNSCNLIHCQETAAIKITHLTTYVHR